MKTRLFLVAFVAITSLMMAASAAVAQQVPVLRQSDFISKSRFFVPAEASPTGKAGYMEQRVYGGKGSAPLNPMEYPRSAKFLALAKSSPAHNASGTYWCTVNYVWVGTNRWTMWYMNEKYVERNTRTHRVTYAKMTLHHGYVSTSAQLAGWNYENDEQNGWTFMDWVGQANGQHFSRYIGHFVAKVIKIPIPVAKRNPNIVILVHWDGTYSFAGTKH